MKKLTSGLISSDICCAQSNYAVLCSEQLSEYFMNIMKWIPVSEAEKKRVNVFRTAVVFVGRRPPRVFVFPVKQIAAELSERPGCVQRLISLLFTQSKAKFVPVTPCKTNSNNPHACDGSLVWWSGLLGNGGDPRHVVLGRVCESKHEHGTWTWTNAPSSLL